MKKIFLFSLLILAILAFGCSKNNNLPAYTPPVFQNFSVAGVNHNLDTVSVGDTVYLSATGTLSDTTQNIYVYVSSAYTVNGVAAVYNYGSAAAPVKLSRNVSTVSVAGLYAWTSAIVLPGATLVPPGTKLTITANFIYQLSLSSEKGILSSTDQGLANKTVFVQ